MNNYSIILPTFNRVQLLQLCIESLIKQNYDKQKYEIIIVDNNSNDSTEKLVKYYLNKYNNIRYINEPRKGLYFTRHTGAFNAKYDYLCFCDDDAIYHPDWLKELDFVYNKNPNVAAVGGKILIKWDKQPPPWIYEYESFLAKIDLADQILLSYSINLYGASLSIKRDVLFNIGGFEPDQIGDRLIGDGEIGLMAKLKKNKLLIGWTPYAITYHLQFVEKNATIKDIERRFKNNGRAFAYSKLKKHNYRKILFCIEVVISALIGIVYQAFKLYFINPRKAYFIRIFYLESLNYMLQVITNKEFYKVILSYNSLFDYHKNE